MKLTSVSGVSWAVYLLKCHNQIVSWLPGTKEAIWPPCWYTLVTRLSEYAVWDKGGGAQRVMYPALVQSRKRRNNIDSTLDDRLVLAGIYTHSESH